MLSKQTANKFVFSSHSRTFYIPLNFYYYFLSTRNNHAAESKFLYFRIFQLKNMLFSIWNVKTRHLHFITARWKSFKRCDSNYAKRLGNDALGIVTRSEGELSEKLHTVRMLLFKWYAWTSWYQAVFFFIASILLPTSFSRMLNIETWWAIGDCNAAILFVVEHKMVYNSFFLYSNDLNKAIVYFHSSHDPSQYPSQDEWGALYLIEKSLAVKCPTNQFYRLSEYTENSYVQQAIRTESAIMVHEVISCEQN